MHTDTHLAQAMVASDLHSLMKRKHSSSKFCAHYKMCFNV